MIGWPCLLARVHNVLVHKIVLLVGDLYATRRRNYQVKCIVLSSRARNQEFGTSQHLNFSQLDAQNLRCRLPRSTGSSGILRFQQLWDEYLVET